MPPPTPLPPPKPAGSGSSSAMPLLILVVLVIVVFAVPTFRARAIDLYQQAKTKITGNKTAATLQEGAATEHGLSNASSGVGPAMVSLDGSDEPRGGPAPASSASQPPPSFAPATPTANVIPPGPDVRTWTDDQGRTVEARFVEVKGGDVVIERVTDGRRFQWALIKLSPVDRDWVRERRTAGPAKP